MLYSGGSAGNAGIGYAWSWDRVHWRKAEINPVFKNGSGPFLERCYMPSLVRDADDSLLLYRAAKDATAYRTFVSRLRAPASGRNTPAPTGSGADPRNTSLFFGRREIPQSRVFPQVTLPCT